MTAPIDPTTSPEQQPADPGAAMSENNTDAAGADTAGEATASEAPKRVRRRLTPELLAGEIHRLDRILVGIVLLLAFLLGSFVAHNSDVWMRLATGHAILHG